MTVEGARSHRPASLRGRGDELERTLSVIERARDTGQATLIAIVGEAGIGKTAFLNTIVDGGQRAGFATGIGRAHERDQIAPMTPLLEALRSGPSPLLSRAGFADLAPLYGHQPWLVDALTGMLEELVLKSPLLIAIDDIHWADQLSMFALRIIPRRLAGFPIAWVLTSRPRSTATNELIDAVSRDVQVEVVELGPLAPSALEELACDRLGTPPDEGTRSLLAGASGSPFLAVELLDGLARGDESRPGTLPLRFVLSALRRLRSLPPEALQMVRTASVLGHTCKLADIAALMEDTPRALLLAALEAAVHAGVLDDDGQQLTFVHDLVRQAIYEDITPSIRREMHRSVVRQIVAAGRSPLDAVPHVLIYASSADGQSERILREAAALLITSMPDAAVDLIERAFELLRPEDPAWIETGLEAITILTKARRGTDAVRIADRLLVSHPSDEDVARIQQLAAVPLWVSGQLDEIVTRVDSALILPGMPVVLRGRLRAYKALGLSRDSDLIASAALGQAALEAGRKTGDETTQSTALHALGEIARNDGRHGDALGYFQELRVLVGNEQLSDVVLTLQLLDRYQEASSLLADARREVEEKSETFDFMSSIVFGQMWQDYSQGLLDEAEAGAATVLRYGEEYEDQGIEAMLLLGRIAQIRGDTVRAREYFVVAGERANRTDDNKVLMTLLLEAWMEECEDDLDGAVRAVEDVIFPKRAIRHRWRLQPHWLVAASRIAVRGGKMTLAQEIAAIAAEMSEKNPDVATFTATALHARGLLNGDADDLRRATELARSGQRPLVCADISAAHGQLLLARSSQEAGLAALHEAWAIYSRLGAFGDLRRVERIFRDAGIRRPRWSVSRKRPTEGWEALTEIERRVARLIANGSTNRETASELSLSPNTVATHLRSIFTKLGVKSRVQLTRAFLSNEAMT
jgi:DNA-binding CsgD family transcriptional regulator/tetratricopeptide (TPR) repeat protein